MIFIEDMKHQWDVMLHPSGNRTKPMGLSQALIYYYKVSFIPMVLSVITEYIYAVYGAQSNLANISSLFPSVQGSAAQSVASYLPLTLIFGVIVDFIIFIPIGIFVGAGIVHLFGKVFRKYGKGYEETVSGFAYAACAVMFISFWIMPLIQSLPIGIAAVVLGMIASIALGIWNLIILIICLAKLQKTSKLASFGILIVPAIIIGILFLVVLALFLAPAGAV
jgi:hypothetical protein